MQVTDPRPAPKLAVPAVSNMFSILVDHTTEKMDRLLSIWLKSMKILTGRPTLSCGCLALPCNRSKKPTTAMNNVQTNATWPAELGSTPHGTQELPPNLEKPSRHIEHSTPSLPREQFIVEFDPERKDAQLFSYLQALKVVLLFNKMLSSCQKPRRRTISPPMHSTPL